MTNYYPVVFESETSGAFSAYVPGLPVYAAADTRAKAERAISDTLAAYLQAHPDAKPTSIIRVARVTDNANVYLVSAAALVGSRTSRRKAMASRLNGRLGGRPKKPEAVTR